jgi:hypothetical protein
MTNISDLFVDLAIQVYKDPFLSEEKKNLIALVLNAAEWHETFSEMKEHYLIEQPTISSVQRILNDDN